MKRAFATLMGGAILGMATAVFVARSAGRSRPATYVPSGSPSMITGASDVAQWIDRGLLQLAEHEVTTTKAQLTDAGTTEPEGETEPEREEVESLVEQRDNLYRVLSYELAIPEPQLSAIREIVEGSPYLGQGNPEVSVHPISRERCRAIRAQAPIVTDDERICGARHMVALFDTATGDPKAAKLCIDQFEFPNIPCEYPLVWVRASEAAKICRILEKRLCDAHEWEGACAGRLRPPAMEYESFAPRLEAEYLHNRARQQTWATGFRPDGRTCATGATKTAGCVDASWERCGTNSYPAGAFPRCVSPFGVYDLHGNVAEHMSLPLRPDQLGALGGVGDTEMKGSWFAFDEYHPHPDDCRWRAPAWHATSVNHETSHFNYHLGFRCCRDLE